MLPGPFTTTVVIPKAQYDIFQHFTLPGRGPIYVEGLMPDGGAGAQASFFIVGYLTAGAEAQSSQGLFIEGAFNGPGPTYNAQWYQQGPTPIMKVKVSESGDGTDTEVALTFYQPF